MEATDKHHPTVAVQVWADVDVGIADFVIYLNSIPGIRTIASCQGTLGEGGQAPYRGYAMAEWTEEAHACLLRDGNEVAAEGNGMWGYVYPNSKTEYGRIDPA